MKLRKFSVLFGVVILVFLLTIFSCSEIGNEISVDKSEYLSVNHSIDFNTLSNSEREAVIKAFSRFSITTTKEGYIIIKEKSGSEINISENIYDFYKKMFDEHNKSIPLKISTRYALPSDSDYVGDENAAVDSAGCVIYSIQGVLYKMGTTVPYDEIKRELMAKGLYNDGVAAGDMPAALGLFFNVSPQTPPYDQNYNYNRHYIMSVWQNVSDYRFEYHCVEFMSSNDGLCSYYDYQNRCYGICDVSQVFQFYYVTGK